MKWAAVMLAIVVVGAVAAFGIYTWGWRDDGNSGDGEAELARAYAEIVARDNGATLLEVERVSDDTWRAQARSRSGKVRCLLIDVSEFDRIGRDEYEGIQPNASCTA